ncbi:MAG TPA: MFS transporter [Gaiellales bacterium]|nr:MFS transporter [Gaiellales bacterium]
MSRKAHIVWTFAITSIALFMTTLDNLVVTTALPTMQRDLHASISGLEWTVNAYTLTFAVLLMLGAALGDRLGRRRVFLAGLGIFTLGSAMAAMSPSIDWLIGARALQGVGGAIVTPLTLTILSDAVPYERRGLALGLWGGISGLGVAIGPLVGGAVVQGLSWQWIFWLNVPIGLAAIPLGAARLRESHGPAARLDVTGVGLVTASALGLVWGLVRANSNGWTSPEIVGSLVAGVLLLIAFVAWERRAREPMLPMRYFENRAFAAANAASLLMFFGMFGSIFLLTQYLQNVQGNSPLDAGLRMLPWTGMPMIVAPIAGALTDRIGARPLLVTGLALQATALAWLAAITAPDVAYIELVPPFAIAGIGMALFFAPVATVVLGSVSQSEAGKASGANNAIRELGGVFGVAVLASIFAHQGGYGSADLFTDGILPALWVGAAVVGVGAVAAGLLPGRGRTARVGEPALQGAD